MFSTVTINYLLQDKEILMDNSYFQLEMLTVFFLQIKEPCSYSKFLCSGLFLCRDLLQSTIKLRELLGLTKMSANR